MSSIIESTGLMEGALDIQGAGAPGAGTDEVQTLTFGGTPTGGTFKLAFDGLQTAAISWSATNNTLRDNVDAALEALPNVGTGNMTTAVGTMTSGIGTLTLTFAGVLAKKAVSLITVAKNSLTGTSPTLGVTRTTPGVNAAGRGCQKGCRYVDTTNGIEYINTGTNQVPVWSAISSAAITVPQLAVADIGALTVGSDIGAFTDPPSAAQMAALRTFVNALKADTAAVRTSVNAALAALRSAGVISP